MTGAAGPRVPPGEKILTRAAFQEAFGVSRETLERLEIYEAVLRTWQRTINLVSPGTLDEIWHRHFADSAQLLDLALAETAFPSSAWGLVGKEAPASAEVNLPTPSPSQQGGGELAAQPASEVEKNSAGAPGSVAEGGKIWLDLGSGGGFPGLVLAILLAERHPQARMTLVESDARKAAFLAEVARKTGVAVEIRAERSEKAATQAKSQIKDVITARALAPLPKLLGLVLPFFSPQTVALFPKGRDADAEVQAAREAFAFEARLVPSLTDTEARIVIVRNLAAKSEG
jgi:16S rRNA (guanine527-N7)-methyltransferase